MRNIRTRAAALALALCVLVGVWPAVTTTAQAAGSVEVQSPAAQLDLSDGSISVFSYADYVAYTQNECTTYSTGGCVIVQSDISTSTSNSITVNAENADSMTVKMTIAGLVMQAETSPMVLKKNAKVVLTIVSDNYLTCTLEDGFTNFSAGIAVPDTASLTIKGTGNLTVQGGCYGAGIGGSYYGSTGQHSYGSVSLTGMITIDGGTIIATGGKCAAGIGAGTNDKGGTITINGGTVTATGGSSRSNWGAAGIGGGGGGTGGKAGAITINGGTVTATGGQGAAGIGGADGCDGGVITITGGTVYANGTNGGAGIGSGASVYNKVTAGTISITGGTIEAVGCSGIGGGASGYSGYSGAGGTVSISNATVTARGRYHAIGGGSLDLSYGCDRITIDETAEMHTSYGDASGQDYQEKITINTQPLDSAAHNGNEASFAVSATGASALSYQWVTSADQTVWTNVDGETANIGGIPVTTDTAGTYVRCEVRNEWGNLLCTDIVQTYILAFSRQPESVELNIDDTAAFVTASTCSNVTYKWQKSVDNELTWSSVEGAIAPTLVLLTTLSENGALYRCVITAANGDQLASDAARITVNSDAVTYTIRDYLQNADGKTYTVADQTVVEAAVGDAVSAPDAVFEGYTRNLNKGVASGTVTADNGLVLERYYDRDICVITFDMQGGSALPDMEAVWGAAVTRPADPSRYGFTFGGWYADSACTQEYTFDTMPRGGATVYAKWISGDEGRGGVEYVINGILLRNASTYEPVSGIPTGKLLAEISVTNLCSVHTDTVMLVTYDKDGRMLEMGYLYAGVPVGGTFTFGMEVDNSGGEVGEVKAFVLSALNGMLPLAEAKSCDGT